MKVRGPRFRSDARGGANSLNLSIPEGRGFRIWEPRSKTILREWGSEVALSGKLSTLAWNPVHEQGIMFATASSGEHDRKINIWAVVDKELTSSMTEASERGAW